MPSDMHVPEDVYGNTCDFGRDNLGRSAQMNLSSEADRFRDLAPLQGHYLPWSYGFYEFTLPDSPSVVGHLMEFIPSIDIAAYFILVLKNHTEVVDKFLTALWRMYIEVHRHDVAHRDIALRNIRMLPEFDLEFQFAIVDLTTARSISHLDKIGKNGMATDIALMDVTIPEDLGEETVYAWLRTPNGKRMEELFKMRASQLAVADP